MNRVVPAVTTTVTATTVTATTQTVLARLQGQMSRVEELLEQQISVLTTRVDELERQNTALQSNVTAISVENSALRQSLQGIGRSNESNVLPASQCSGGPRPRVAAAGQDVAVESCSGSITLSSRECTVDPCDLARGLQQAEAKLNALGNL